MRVDWLGTASMPSTSATAGSQANHATRESLSAPLMMPPSSPRAVSEGSKALGLEGQWGRRSARTSRKPWPWRKWDHTTMPPWAVRRWSVKPILMDDGPPEVEISTRTVWFASCRGVLDSFFCIKTSPPDGTSPFQLNRSGLGGRILVGPQKHAYAQLLSHSIDCSRGDRNCVGLPAAEFTRGCRCHCRIPWIYKSCRSGVCHDCCFKRKRLHNFATRLLSSIQRTQYRLRLGCA